ncbi:cache domain-containing sensor histidine kinase [Gorillibacterium sp. sgz5001074]|uniref:cache domain-containing sensor histidine kinase n=1 Tax=Gorillibacterium sp. sgz5001074 TaxID=3446695 RepID=UPI003F680990
MRIVFPEFRKKTGVSFHHKIFISHLVIVMFTFLMFLTISFYQTSRNARDSSIYSAGQTVAQTLEYMTFILSSIEHTMEQLVFDEQVQATFNRDTTQFTGDKLQQVKDSMALTNLFGSSKSFPVQGVRMYIPDEIGLSKENETFFELSQATNAGWFSRISGTRKSVWLPVQASEKSRSAPSLSLVRKIPSLMSYDKTLGVLRLDVPETVFSDMLDKVKYTAGSSSLLINSYGEVISTSAGDTFWEHPENIGLLRESFPNVTYPALQWKDNVIFRDKEYLVGIQSIPYSDWKIATAIPWADMMEPYTHTKNNMILIVLLIVPLSFLLSYFFSVRSTKQIRKLIFHIRKTVQGSYYTPIPSYHKDEIGELIQNYNVLITNISTLLEEKYAFGQQVKNLELKSLQAQINPHFLYNTLDLIHWMAADVQAPQIGELVQSLSKFYHLSLSNGQEWVTLSHELEHITHYVHIQNMRFDDGIRLQIDVPEELMNSRMLKLTLQPIIENSILHGILGREAETGTIRITAAEYGGDLVLTVVDDGIGIPEDQLRNLLTAASSKRTGGFGVRNIHERIQLVYGADFGLSYSSVYGEGTSVTIRLAKDEGV